MSNTEQRFALSMRQADDDEPGLIRERDGTVWLVNPDGTRTQLPGAGSGVPDGGSTGEVLTKVSNADGDADWEASGGSQPQLLGPYTVAFDTPDLGSDGALLVTLGPGTLIVDLLAVVDTAWDVVSSCNINIGGSDYGPPNDDYTPLYTIPDLQNLANSYSIGAGFVSPTLDVGDPTRGRARFGYLSTAGALVATSNATGAAQGSLRVWALAVLP